MSSRSAAAARFRRAEDPGGVTQRIRIGVDREDARVVGIRIAQRDAAASISAAPHLGTRIDPPGA